MTTKLRIDISQGIIDVEGDPELVREVYADFKARLSRDVTPTQPALTTASIGKGDEITSLSSKSKS